LKNLLQVPMKRKGHKMKWKLKKLLVGLQGQGSYPVSVGQSVFIGAAGILLCALFVLMPYIR